MAEIIITAENFEQEVLNSELPVLIDFWATWCAPCRMLAPIIDEIAEEYAGEIKVGKVNVDEQPALAAQFRIASIPTVMLFREGKAAAVTMGYQPKERIVALFKEN